MQLYDKALSCALNAYLSDWSEFENDPEGALWDLSAGANNVTLWAPLENECTGAICDAIESLAEDIHRALLSVKG